jgi:predicted hydrolase (HD superfamily)
MSVLIENARRILCREFNEDEEFRQSYIDNIAMLLHDKYGIINYEERNNAAEDIMNLIFCSGGENDS